MDWQSVLWVGFIAMLFVMMLRGCGGCGTQARRTEPRDEAEDHAGSHGRTGN